MFVEADPQFPDKHLMGLIIQGSPFPPSHHWGNGINSPNHGVELVFFHRITGEHLQNQRVTLKRLGNVLH